jgi:cytosine/uracil/thiamine/allantoin permease
MGSDGTKGVPADVPTASDAQENHGLAPVTPAKENRTAEQLAAMIGQDMSKVDGFPRRGVTVTVYGLNPWNSMLTFGVDAGPVRNKAELQGFCDIITERLRRLYDIGA